LLNPNICADGLSPLAALRLGRLDAALRAARAHGEHVAP
jgi:hypothetical protein